MRASDKDLIGKYVCYGNEEGGFCWGKIVGETKINMIEGKVAAFIIDDRMTCKGKGHRVIKHDKSTILPRSGINLDTDILNEESLMADFDNEQLFRVAMGDMSCVGLGVKNMAEHGCKGVEASVADTAASILKERMEV